MEIPEEVHRTTYSIILGRILAKYRKVMSMDQKVIAAKLGIKQPAWSRIERGEVGLDMETLSLVARILSRRPEDIINEAEIAKTNLEAIGIEVLMTRPNQKNNITLALLTGAALAFLLLQVAKK